MKHTVFLNKLKLKLKNSGLRASNLSSKDTPNWYRETWSRLQAEEFLSDHEIGNFVVRKSETHRNCFVISVRVPRFINPTLMGHYLVCSNQEEDAFWVRGFEKRFPDLSSLVTHCSLMRDMLPVMLSLKTSTEDVSCSSRGDYTEESNLVYTFFSSPSTSTSTSSLLSHVSSQSELSDWE